MLLEAAGRPKIRPAKSARKPNQPQSRSVFKEGNEGEKVTAGMAGTRGVGNGPTTGKPRQQVRSRGRSCALPRAPEPGRARGRQQTSPPQARRAGRPGPGPGEACGERT